MPLNFKHLRLLALTAGLLAAAAVQGAPDDDARAAYDSGDYDTAYRIWSELAEQNDGRAQYALGVMHATGNGRDKDPAKAFEWFSKAAENGHLKAMYNLGVSYWTGQGTLEDRAEAAHWWRMAAERGDVVSQYNLGVAYYNGLGVDQDLVEAARWIRSAAEQDYEVAVELLPTLEEKLRETAAAPAEESGTPVAEGSGAAASGAEVSQAEAGAAAEPAEPSPTTSTQAGQASEDPVIDVDFTTALVQADEAPVYAANDASAPVIDKLSRDTALKVVERRGDWVKVESASGFPLWVFGTYVSGDGEDARVTGNGVRARSLPSTSDQSVSPGQFRENDRVAVIRAEGDWKYVQAPSHLHAWVRAGDIRLQERATQSWADRWTAAGGSL